MKNWEKEYKKELEECIIVHLDVERGKKSLSEAFEADIKFDQFIKDLLKEQKQEIYKKLEAYQFINGKWKKIKIDIKL